jgi:hypothetical protein
MAVMSSETPSVDRGGGGAKIENANYDKLASRANAFFVGYGGEARLTVKVLPIGYAAAAKYWLASRLITARASGSQRRRGSFGRAPVICDAGQIDGDLSNADGKRGRAGGPAVREASVSKFGLMPTRPTHLVVIEFESRPVDLQPADAKAELPRVHAFGDRMRGNERV